MIQRITPPGAPAPRGPYSPAVRAGDFLFISGQVPIDPLTDSFSPGDIRHQTRLVLENIRRILEGCGASPGDVAQCTVYLADAGDFAAMNEVYAEFFGPDKPARTTVQAGFMAPGLKIEVGCVAYKPARSAP